MRSHSEIMALRGVDHGGTNMVYHKDKGYLIWKRGTGDNIELTYIEVDESQRGKGLAMKLYEGFCRMAKNNPPYYSVYAFTLGSNDTIHYIYRKMGFREIDLGKSVYKSDTIKMFWIPFEEMCEYFGV